MSQDGALLLQQATWPEVEAYLARCTGLIVPIGSTEQHGPMGLIGTDALCAETVARAAAETAAALVAPTLAYAPAQFNLAFPGTVSIRAATQMALVEDVVRSLHRQGFTHFFFLNGHGANLAPVRAAFHDLYDALGGDGRLRLRIKSWWDYAAVNDLRAEYYAEREGMHATPSEIAITQAGHRQVAPPEGLGPPEILDPAFLREHAGDQHPDAASHRARFPDGRVGSDSALAAPDQGRRLIAAAAGAVAEDFRHFLEE